MLNRFVVRTQGGGNPYYTGDRRRIWSLDPNMAIKYRSKREASKILEGRKWAYIEVMRIKP